MAKCSRGNEWSGKVALSLELSSVPQNGAVLYSAGMSLETERAVKIFTARFLNVTFQLYWSVH